MCHHNPVPLFRRPPDTAHDLLLSYVLHMPTSRVVCTHCGLTGSVRSHGRVRWYYPGTVGHLDRERDLARAGEWNAKVDAAIGTGADTVEGDRDHS